MGPIYEFSSPQFSMILLTINLLLLQHSDLIQQYHKVERKKEKIKQRNLGQN